MTSAALKLDQVEAIVGGAIINNAVKVPVDVSRETTLEALHYDSLSYVEAIVEIETELGCDLDDDVWIDRWGGATTIQEAIDSVVSSLGVKP